MLRQLLKFLKAKLIAGFIIIMRCEVGGKLKLRILVLSFEREEEIVDILDDEEPVA